MKRRKPQYLCGFAAIQAIFWQQSENGHPTAKELSGFPEPDSLFRPPCNAIGA
jgi:hypothetical protein